MPPFPARLFISQSQAQVVRPGGSRAAVDASIFPTLRGLSLYRALLNPLGLREPHWHPNAHAQIAQRWFSWPNIGFLWPVPIATALIAYRIWREIAGGHDARPFLLSIALFLMAFVGLGISLWPYTVPYAATLWQAASSEAALEFVGIGVVVTVPFILAYFGYAHWIFRGKTGVGAGYGDPGSTPRPSTTTEVSTA